MCPREDPPASSSSSKPTVSTCDGADTRAGGMRRARSMSPNMARLSPTAVASVATAATAVPGDRRRLRHRRRCQRADGRAWSSSRDAHYSRRTVRGVPPFSSRRRSRRCCTGAGCLPAAGLYCRDAWRRTVAGGDGAGRWRGTGGGRPGAGFADVVGGAGHDAHAGVSLDAGECHTGALPDLSTRRAW